MNLENRMFGVPWNDLFSQICTYRRYVSKRPILCNAPLRKGENANGSTIDPACKAHGYKAKLGCKANFCLAPIINVYVVSNPHVKLPACKVNFPWTKLVALQAESTVTEQPYGIAGSKCVAAADAKSRHPLSSSCCAWGDLYYIYLSILVYNLWVF